MANPEKCKKCNGIGKVRREVCPTCKGAKMVIVIRTETDTTIKPFVPSTEVL